MTYKDAIDRLREIRPASDDPESARYDANCVLCDFLKTMGYGDVVDEWEKIYKY